MKKTTLLLFAMTMFIGLTSCKNENPAAKVDASKVAAAQKRDAEAAKGAAVASFDKLEHDFGTMQAGDIVETTFVITNTGKTDLKILDAKVTCGCTVPQWPKEAIAPGASEEIVVKFNSRGKRGRQSKNITLMTNTANGREVVKIKGFVETK
ncbi:MAG: DUF1573 domain-containing protein [Flavobacteriaceae bacterium]